MARAVPILPSRDWVITVECTADGVVIAPGGIPIKMEALSSNRSENPLRQTLQQMIARRQSMTRPGEAPDRAVIHFRVWPDGLRAYHLAYPSVEPLRVPMTRENLRSDSSWRPSPAGAP
jgi:hypothetical protein